MISRSIVLLGATCLVAQQSAAPTYVAVVSGADTHITGSMTTTPDGVAAASGAKIESAKHNASLKLTRGGQITLCQRSVLGLDAHGSQLSMALQTGTMEAEYPQSSAADNLLTADYRISVISGSGMSGQIAAYRVGIGDKGDVLLQVMPTSQSYLVVASNFDNAQAVVRPGEIRGFPSLGSPLTSHEIEQQVSLRCPVESKPETQTMLAATEGKTPVDALQVPLAYRSPELPAAETKAPETPRRATTPPVEANATVSTPVPVQTPSALVTSAASQPGPTTSTRKAAGTPKTGNAFTRFWRRLFGRKT